MTISSDDLPAIAAAVAKAAGVANEHVTLVANPDGTHTLMIVGVQRAGVLASVVAWGFEEAGRIKSQRRPDRTT